MSESAEILNLTNGSLVLKSAESKKLVYDLLDNGMFWEYLSVLIEEKASGGQNYADHLDKRLDELNAKIDKLIAGGGAVSTVSSTSNSGQGTSDLAMKLAEEAKQVRLDTNKLAGKGSSLLTKMSSMRRD